MTCNINISVMLVSVSVLVGFVVGDFGNGLSHKPFKKGQHAKGLSYNYYHESCPQTEKVVRDVTWRIAKTTADNLAANLIRLNFHDCFVRGCDASILLDTIGNEKAEKDAGPNQTLEGFDDIDTIKSEVEKVCPGVVSCADIIALAARDAVSFQFKRPMWEVLTGRKDGMISKASDVGGNIPSPFSNFTVLKQLFVSKGLDVSDHVALSGAHTIGAAHCNAFSRRLYNFTGRGDQDLSLNENYAEFLKKQCPNPANSETTVQMDPQTSLSFDNRYFKNLLEQEGLFQSDAALLTDTESAEYVTLLQRSNGLFFAAFAKSMKKMNTIGVLTGSDGEIRRNCHFVN